MNQRETDTSEQVLKFAPKEKAPDRLSLRKFERRLTWQKKTVIGP
jgi:hypothetical protein